MKVRSVRFLLAAAAPVSGLVLAVSGCHPGALAPDPTPMTAAGAMREPPPACREVPERGAPLVVDWTSHQRADLENAMKDGVPVVSYTCSALTLLDCKAKGGYGYTSASLKRDTIQLVGRDDIQANLPAGGLSLAGQMTRDSALDLALVMVGKHRTTVTTAVRPTLVGDAKECAKATHFVRGAYVGAFAMATGTAGKIATATEIFKIGASASTQRAKSVVRLDGEPSKCAPGEKPSADCGAILRLELKAIAPGDVAPAEDAVEAPDCPKGTFLVDGRCTAKPTKAYVCQAENERECRTQCDAGNTESCGRLAFILHYGVGGARQDLAAARALYQRSCEAGDENACSGFAFLLDKGLGSGPADVQRAIELHQMACDRGAMRGCNNLGVAYQRGHGVTRDAKRAADLFRRACDGGHVMGCRNLGEQYLGGKGGVARDVNRASQLFQKACESAPGDRGCMRLADLYRTGKNGHPKSEERARELYKASLATVERACEAGSRVSCRHAGEMYMNGWGTTASAERARALYDKGCTLGAADSCQQLGALDARSGDFALAGRSFDKACGLGNETACATLGGYLQDGSLPRDDKRAGELLEKSCAADVLAACHTLAKMTDRGDGTRTRDPVMARMLVRKACDGELAEACTTLGIYYEEGRGLNPNDADAAGVYKKACDGGSAEGCHRLAVMLKEGRGTSRDPEAASAAQAQACKLGSQIDCASTPKVSSK